MSAYQSGNCLYTDCTCWCTYRCVYVQVVQLIDKSFTGCNPAETMFIHVSEWLTLYCLPSQARVESKEHVTALVTASASHRRMSTHTLSGLLLTTTLRCSHGMAVTVHTHTSIRREVETWTDKNIKINHDSDSSQFLKIFPSFLLLEDFFIFFYSKHMPGLWFSNIYI